METVDMSVDKRSTHGRYLGRCIHRVSVDCRSSIGRYIGDVLTDHWITFGREIDRQSVAIASAECRWAVGQVSVDASADTRLKRKKNEDFALF